MLFSFFLLIWASISFYVDGIPAISNYVVNRTPISIDKEIGRKVRKEILNSASIDSVKTELLSQFHSALGYDSNTKLYAVKADVFNAFALPDNSIFVFDQVLKEIESYPELAALLGHEYTHINKRHGMKTLAHSLSRELITTILTGGATTDKFIGNSNQLLELKKSREFETEADKEGVYLLIKKAIDANGMSKLIKRMKKIEERDGTEIPFYLSSHPNTEDRLENAEELIRKEHNNYVNNQKLEELFQQLTTFENGTN